MKRFLRLSIVLITAFLRAPSAQALTVYLLSDSNGLTTFDSDNPAIAPPVPTPISGLGAFDLVGIDVRTTVQTLSPANPGVGSLWAMGVQGTDAQFFVINPATHVATPVGPVIPGIEGVDGPNAWYFAHDPGRDRFRLINFTNNYELNPNTMSVVKQADLVGFHNVNGSAFETVSYGQNAKMFFLSQVPSDSLHTSSNIASGGNSLIGALGIGDFPAGAGLDIYQDTMLLAAIPVPLTLSLYTVNRSTGAANLLGLIGLGTGTVRAIAIAPLTFPKKLPVNLKVKGKKKLETLSSSVKLKGTAKSKAGIKRVEYKGGKVKKFKKAKGKARWKARVRLKPGRNVIKIRAIGNNDVRSKVKKVRVIRL